MISIIANFSHGRCELRTEGPQAEVIVLIGQGKRMDPIKLGEIERFSAGYVLGRHRGKTRKEVARLAWDEWFERWDRRRRRMEIVKRGRRWQEMEREQGIRNG